MRPSPLLTNLPGSPQLEALAKRHGTLGLRLLQLRKPAQEEIANAAYEEGFVNALNALEVSANDLGQAMRVAGYDQCGACEEWFPELELEETENAEFLEVGDNPKRCEECKLAEDADWAAPPPPEPTTPEEIAEAEAKKQKARDAVIAQERRREEREAILASVPPPVASVHGESAGNPQKPGT